jgi:hypothetical protein
MSLKLKKTKLSYMDQEVHALVFLPDASKTIKPSFGVFTHGYTSHKASILNWPSRLVEEGMSCIIFDLPGHYLGGFSEVESFDDFKTEAPKLFVKALEVLKQEFLLEFPLNGHFLDDDEYKVAIGGHSLGALLSLLALSDINEPNINAICVGFGMPPKGVTHIFDTPFYKSTLNIRGQLVSPGLGPKKVFPWIKEAKEKLSVQNKEIHFITGADDLVVGEDGSERLVKLLSEQNNHVSLEKPSRLPHHQPELAASYVKRYLKDQGFI